MLESACVPSSLSAGKGALTPLGLGLTGEVPEIRTCLAIGTHHNSTDSRNNRPSRAKHSPEQWRPVIASDGKGLKLL